MVQFDFYTRDFYTLVGARVVRRVGVLVVRLVGTLVVGVRVEGLVVGVLAEGLVVGAVEGALVGTLLVDVVDDASGVHTTFKVAHPV